MSWDVIGLLDQNDAEVRRRAQAEHAETTMLLADLLTHLYTGLERRGRRGMTSEVEQWAATFLGHAVASMKCAFDQLLDGYYSQAIGTLRNAVEDMSTVAYLSRHPAEAAALSAARDQMEANPKKAEVQTAQYRIALQKLGDASLAAAMDKAHELVKALHLFSHPSLYAVTLAQTDEGVAMAGYYSADDLVQAAYMFVCVYQFLEPAVASFVGPADAEWTAARQPLTDRCARWIAPVNREMGMPEPPIPPEEGQ